MKSHVFSLNKSLLVRFQRKNNNFCVVCGRTFEIGDRVVSRRNKRDGTRHYHETCFEGLYVGAEG